MNEFGLSRAKGTLQGVVSYSTQKAKDEYTL
jgi:hypothetical protein